MIMEVKFKLSKLDIVMGVIVFLTYIYQIIVYEFNVKLLFPFKMMTVVTGLYWYLIKRSRYSVRWKRQFLLPLEFAVYFLVIGLIYVLIVYLTGASWLIGF